jgi:hypothetical protein
LLGCFQKRLLKARWGGYLIELNCKVVTNLDADRKKRNKTSTKKKKKNEIDGLCMFYVLCVMKHSYINYISFLRNKKETPGILLCFM